MPMMIFTTLFFLGIFIMFVFILFGQEKVIKQVNKELESIRAQLEIVEKRLATQQQQTLNLPLDGQERTKTTPVADTLTQPTQTHNAQAAPATGYSQAQQVPVTQKSAREDGAVFIGVNFGEAAKLKPQPDLPHLHTSPVSSPASSMATKEFPSPMTEAYTVRKHKDYPQQSAQFPQTNVYQAEHERLAPPRIAQNPLATNANTNGAPQDLELFMAPPKRR